MKIVCSGDWHIRSTATKYRNPDYYDLMFGKIEWILQLAAKVGSLVILQPGDFFDTPDISNKTMIKVIQTIGETRVFTIYGQHDTKYRNIDNTALTILAEADVVELLNDEPVEYEENKQVDIYGASWETDIPKVDNKNHYNILVLHRMITKGGPLFPDQTDYDDATKFAKSYNQFDLIVSGDNHQSFSYIAEHDHEATLINCGSLMRMTTAQYKHKPCVWIADTIKGTVEQHFIPIKPAAEVFKPEAAEIKERDEKMEAFIKTLTVSKDDSKLSFEDNLKKIMASQKLGSNVTDLIDTFITNHHTQGDK